MSFQGSLDTVGLEDVFQLFSFSRKSGALRLQRDEKRGAVYFHEGEVYYATTNPSEGIGKGLVNAGVISSDDWKAVLTRTRGNDVSQGKALIEQDGVDTALVEAFVRERVEDAIFKLLQWESGDFALQDEVHPLGPVFVFASEPLLNEGRKRLDIWNEIRDAIPSTTMGVGLRRDVDEDVDSITLDRDEWRVVATLTPGVSIEELSAALGDTEYAICRILYRMLDRDILELHSPEKLEVIRRLMASAHSLDTQTSEDASAPQDVSEFEEAVAEVVVEQAEDPFGSEFEEAPAAHTTGDADAATVEAAAAMGIADIPTAYESEVGESTEDGATGEVAEVATDSVGDEPIPEEHRPPRVSLADLAAAAEDGDDIPVNDGQGMFGTDEQGAYEAHAETVVEGGETWQHAAAQEEVPTHYEYQAVETDDTADPLSFSAPADSTPADRGITEPPLPVAPGPDIAAELTDGGYVGSGDGEEHRVGADETSGGGAGEGGEELDKGLILRLIAGVRSL